jgi:hypothetical protein
MRNSNLVCILFSMAFLGGCQTRDITPIDPQNRWACPDFISSSDSSYQTEIEILNVTLKPVTVRLEFRDSHGHEITDLGETFEVPIRGTIKSVVKMIPGQYYIGSVQVIADGPILPMGQIFFPPRDQSVIETMTFYPVKEK